MVPEENPLHDPGLENVLRCEICGGRIYDVYGTHKVNPEEKGDTMSKHVTDKRRVCEDPGCSNEFKPKGNRQIYCGEPDCPHKKPQKRVRRSAVSKGKNGEGRSGRVKTEDTEIVWISRAQKIKDLVDEITDLESGIVEKRDEIISLLKESHDGGAKT